MIELIVLAIAGVVVFALVFGLVISVMLKAVFWLVLFPLRLVLWILLLPLLLLKAVLGGIFMLLFGVVGLVLAIVFGVLLAIPLLPLLALGFLIWALVRSGDRPALVRQ